MIVAFNSLPSILVNEALRASLALSDYGKIFEHQKHFGALTRK